MDRNELTEDEKTVIDALREDPEFIRDLAEILGQRKRRQPQQSSDPGEHPGAS